MADISGEDIGANIREQRNKKGLSQAELGSMVGTSGQSIYYYELGKRTLKFEMVERIANALEVPIDTLLGSHSFISGKSKKVKSLPLKWATILNLKELLLPDGKEDVKMEGILQDHDVQMFLYGLFVRLKDLNETDRYVFLQLLNELVEKNISIDELETISIVSLRMYLLNEEGLAHVSRLIEDVSELPRYRKTKEME